MEWRTGGPARPGDSETGGAEGTAADRVSARGASGPPQPPRAVSSRGKEAEALEWAARPLPNSECEGGSGRCFLPHSEPLLLWSRAGVWGGSVPAWGSVPGLTLPQPLPEAAVWCGVCSRAGLARGELGCRGGCSCPAALRAPSWVKEMPPAGLSRGLAWSAVLGCAGGLAGSAGGSGNKGGLQGHFGGGAVGLCWGATGEPSLC